MPVLSISLVVGVLHQSVVFQNSFPVFIVFFVAGVLANELFD
jgi:hypothetical protein